MCIFDFSINQRALTELPWSKRQFKVTHNTMDFAECDILSHSTNNLDVSSQLTRCPGLSISQKYINIINFHRAAKFQYCTFDVLNVAMVMNFDVTFTCFCVLINALQWRFALNVQFSLVIGLTVIEYQRRESLQQCEPLLTEDPYLSWLRESPLDLKKLMKFSFSFCTVYGWNARNWSELHWLGVL